MKQSHLILTMGMIAWFSTASPELASVDETSNMVNQTLLYEPSQNEAALTETTLSESTQLKAEQQEAAQREEAIQLMEERRLDSRRSALQFLPFEPENRR